MISFFLLVHHHVSAVVTNADMDRSEYRVAALGGLYVVENIPGQMK
jgi:hypothetical protein